MYATICSLKFVFLMEAGRRTERGKKVKVKPGAGTNKRKILRDLKKTEMDHSLRGSQPVKSRQDPEQQA